MKIIYLCDCGAKNQVAAKHRPRGGAPVFFFCQRCGKGSHDRCDKCHFLTPVGSHHAFCQQCSADSTAIRRGVETIDLAFQRRELFWALIRFSAMLYAYPRWIQPWMQSRSDYAVAHHQTLFPIWWLFACWFCCLSPALVIPLHTLIVGKKTPPLWLRALAQQGRFLALDDLEDFLIRFARRGNIRMRKFYRRCQRNLRRWNAARRKADA